ncbi:hypothetical protein ACJX0J_039669 [Zea mays]
MTLKMNLIYVSHGRYQGLKLDDHTRKLPFFLFSDHFFISEESPSKMFTFMQSSPSKSLKENISDDMGSPLQYDISYSVIIVVGTSLEDSLACFSMKFFTSLDPIGLFQ